MRPVDEKGINLHRAAKDGDSETASKLLAAGADPNAYDERGHTPLHEAVASPEADVKLVRLLLAHGADPKLAIRPAFPDGEAYAHHGLSLAVQSWSLPKVRALLEAGMELRYVRDGGFDALIDAAHGGPAGPAEPDALARLGEVIDFLLERGVPATGRTMKGATALTASSLWLRLDAIERLLHAGAAEADLKWTPLHWAVALGEAGDVSDRLGDGAPLEAKDHCGRTALVLAAELGDLEKVELLWDRGADRKARWRSGSLLELALFRRDPKLLDWLLARGVAVNERNEFGFSPLHNAVSERDPRAVSALLRAGAPVDQPSEHGFTALHEAADLELIRLLLDAGADAGGLSHEGRRVLLGLSAEADLALLAATREEYDRAKKPREGRANPEEAAEPFWLGMIRSGVSAYAAKTKYRDDAAPIWTAHRFGQSLTELPDGRLILVAGEHEDSYDDDFHIYNDVIVRETDGSLRVFLYPRAEFPPTDFHSATLVGDWVYLVGNLGYPEARRPSFTPVYRLDTRTLRIEPLKTSGSGQGWIHKHRAALEGSVLKITGGSVFKLRDGKGSLEPNDRTYRLDLETGTWLAAS